MLCPRCGREVGSELRLCDICRDETARRRQRKQTGTYKVSHIQPRPGNTSRHFVGYAGFWLRAIALLIDGAILNIISSGVWGLFAATFTQKFATFTNAVTSNLQASGQSQAQLSPELLTAFTTMLPMIIGMTVLNIILSWFYFAFLEATPLMGTPGKLIVGLKVTNKVQQQASFFRTTARYLGKFLSMITLVGYLMAGITREKQALHDMLSGCLVLKRDQISALRVIASIIIAIVLFGISNSVQGAYFVAGAQSGYSSQTMP